MTPEYSLTIELAVISSWRGWGGALCACASLRSIADVGQGALQPHSAAEGGRRDERCATVMLVWTDAAPRQCDIMALRQYIFSNVYALLINLCREPKSDAGHNLSQPQLSLTTGSTGNYNIKTVTPKSNSSVHQQLRSNTNNITALQVWREPKSDAGHNLSQPQLSLTTGSTGNYNIKTVTPKSNSSVHQQLRSNTNNITALQFGREPKSDAGHNLCQPQLSLTTGSTGNYNIKTVTPKSNSSVHQQLRSNTNNITALQVWREPKSDAGHNLSQPQLSLTTGSTGNYNIKTVTPKSNSSVHQQLRSNTNNITALQVWREPKSDAGHNLSQPQLSLTTGSTGNYNIKTVTPKSNSSVHQQLRSNTNNITALQFGREPKSDAGHNLCQPQLSLTTGSTGNYNIKTVTPKSNSSVHQQLRSNTNNITALQVWREPKSDAGHNLSQPQLSLTTGSTGNYNIKTVTPKSNSPVHQQLRSNTNNITALQVWRETKSDAGHSLSQPQLSLTTGSTGNYNIKTVTPKSNSSVHQQLRPNTNNITALQFGREPKSDAGQNSTVSRDKARRAASGQRYQLRGQE
ncbi:hypothetical protein J6590_048286 [Homalodisca vitripennis]|nr:hypothetical protein J6590_048286 [Homalodisca vitripennis]